MRASREPRPAPWSREQIRTARSAPLRPRLEKRGLALRDRGGGNLEVEPYKGLLVKASYWRWPERDLAGNAIDFYVHVLGLLALRSAPSEGGIRPQLTTGNRP